MMFYSWSNIEEFNLWHEKVKIFLGIPYPGRNGRTDEVDESSQWTLFYTQPTIVADEDIRAFVEDNIASAIPDGIGELSESPPFLQED